MHIEAAIAIEVPIYFKNAEALFTKYFRDSFSKFALIFDWLFRGARKHDWLCATDELRDEKGVSLSLRKRIESSKSISYCRSRYIAHHDSNTIASQAHL